MGIITEEDSIYKCNLHDYRTGNMNEWFKHKFGIPHYEMGTSECVYCRIKVKFDVNNKLRQENLEFTAPAICPNCAPNYQTIPNCEVIQNV